MNPHGLDSACQRLRGQLNEVTAAACCAEEALRVEVRFELFGHGEAAMKFSHAPL